MLRLAGETSMVPCPTCNGRGRVPSPETVCVRTGVGGDNMRGGVVRMRGWWPVPCPECKGKKIVARGAGADVKENPESNCRGSAPGTPAEP